MQSSRWVAFGVFAVVLTVYLSSPVMVQSDSIWSIPTAASLWLRADTNLDEYGQALERQPYGLITHEGHRYTIFPVGPSLAAVPFLAVMDAGLGLIGKDPWGWRARLHQVGDIDYGYFNTTERFIASVYTSLAILFVFLTARRRGSLGVALLTAGAVAFGTGAYTTASRVLWQHGPSLFAISFLVWLLSRPAGGKRWAALTGLVVACAYVLRPTNSFAVLLVTGLFALRRRSVLLPYLAGAAPIAALFCGFSLATYGALLPPYYRPGYLSPGGGHFGEALAGLLISPGRGLFVYSPILLVALWGVAMHLRQRRLREHELVFVLAPVLQWLVLASFRDWWGGHSIGPRYFTDVLPYLAYFLVTPLTAVLQAPKERWPATAGVAAALGLSLFIHAHGATSYAVHLWNEGPPDVSAAPSRLWSWRDAPFLRGLVARPGS